MQCWLSMPWFSQRTTSEEFHNTQRELRHLENNETGVRSRAIDTLSKVKRHFIYVTTDLGGLQNICCICNFIH